MNYYYEADELFDEQLWDEVMGDFFPDAKDEDEIADMLDDIWND